MRRAARDGRTRKFNPQNVSAWELIETAQRDVFPGAMTVKCGDVKSVGNKAEQRLVRSAAGFSRRFGSRKTVKSFLATAVFQSALECNSRRVGADVLAPGV